MASHSWPIVAFLSASNLFSGGIKDTKELNKRIVCESHEQSTILRNLPTKMLTMQLQTGSIHLNILCRGLSCVLHHTTRATNSHHYPIIPICASDDRSNNGRNVWSPLVNSERSIQRSRVLKLLLNIGVGNTRKYRADLGVRQLILLKRVCWVTTPCCGWWKMMCT